MGMFGSGLMQGLGSGLQNAQRTNMLKQMMTAQGTMQPPALDPNAMPEQLAGPPPDPALTPQQDMGGMLKAALMRMFMPQ